MGFPGWSRTPAQNGAIDRVIQALDGASSRATPESFREFMAAARRYADDQGGALVTTGTLNAYVVQTGSGLTELRSGLALLVKADRTNTAVATLNVDGLGPLPWVDAGGVPLQPGRLSKNRFYATILDTLADGSAVAWRVQAGASTLDEIPGYVDLSAGIALVAEKAPQVEAARAEVAANQAVVASNRVATDAAAQNAATQASTAQAAAGQAQAAVALGLVRFDTLAQLNANLTPANGAQGEVWNDGLNNGTYRKSGAAGTGSWSKVSDDTLPSVSARVTAFSVLQAASRMARVRAATGRARYDIAGQTVDGSTFQEWAILNVPDRRIALSRFTSWLVTANAGFARLLIYSRDPAQINDAVQPGYSGDTLLYDATYPITAVADKPAFAFSQRLDIPILSGGLRSGWDGNLIPTRGYVFRYLLQDGAGTATNSTGAGLAAMPANGSTALDRGLFRQNNSFNPLSATIALAYELGEALNAEIGNADGPKIERVTVADPVQQQWSGLTVTLPRMVVERGSAAIPMAARQITFTAPNSNFQIDSEPSLLGDSYPLNYEYILAVSGARRTDQAGNPAIAEGTDFTVDKVLGRIANGTSGIPGGTPIIISYRAPKTRYDLVVIDAQSGALSVVQGVERGRDVSEYRPTAPTGTIPLFYAYVTVDRGVDLVPICQFRDLIRVGDEQTDLDWIERSRRRLPRLARLMRQGATIRLCAYGDSITTQGGIAQADWYVPGGLYRDTPGFYDNGGLAQDTIAAIPRFNSGDGNGLNHHKRGWVWFLKNRIEAHSASLVQIINLGIGGTASGDTEPNGRFPARVAAVTAAQPHVVVIGFGMNEIGSNLTYLNIRDLIRQFRQAGIESIVQGVPLTPGATGFRPVDQWLTTNEFLVRAAEDEGAAFVPFARLFHPANTGALGISRRTACQTNGINHPGPGPEMEAYGRALALVCPN